MSRSDHTEAIKYKELNHYKKTQKHVRKLIDNANTYLKIW